MNMLFKVMGVSKQSFHQYHNRMLIRLQEEANLIALIEDIRKDHPTMGCRDMYFKLAPETIGRDAFEELCRMYGFMSQRVRHPRLTTDSRGVKPFDNLVKDLVLTGADQLWVSDITYFSLENRFYYLTFILDAYTKRILGHSTSKSLFVEDTSLAAFTMALKTRKKDKMPGLIFHSDRGGQYYAKAFLKLTDEYAIQNSMCKYPWENPYAERINGVIKNNYLIHWEIKTYLGLLQSVDRAVELYNTDKPHKSLGRLTPVEFEKTIFAAEQPSSGSNVAQE